jgi:leucyl/phenylalanyl-tRNA--protein transferase
MQVSIFRLRDDSCEFPNPREARDDGLLAWGGDLSDQRLLEAYYNGIFPWSSQDDPLLWWSPNPRLLLFPTDFKISKSLSKSRKKFTVKYNSNFEAVIQKCSALRIEKKNGTWITTQMINAYIDLHHLGHAKSVECYRDGKLVGGLYGVMVGSVFCGESMFSTENDASKIALLALCEMMQKSGGEFIDCQMPTEHLISLGAKVVTRDVYLDLLFKCRDKKVDFS